MFKYIAAPPTQTPTQEHETSVHERHVVQQQLKDIEARLLALIESAKPLIAPLVDEDDVDRQHAR